jgi:TonB-linked SusC/RagA family outer membrane protein
MKINIKFYSIIRILLGIAMPIFFLVLNIAVLNAQEMGRLRGQILDKEGKPLSGVTVNFINSNHWTTSDSKGFFTVLANTKDTMKLSLIGYETLFIVPEQITSSFLILTMVQVQQVLEEVIVQTGYYQLPLERATGSFVHVNNELFNRRVGASITERLKDVVPGYIEHSNGRIRIRGQSTLNADADPLIIVDNFPYEDNINNLNPEDVESVTVLKDAAAASIWGAKAGNGVIVITTKKAAYGQNTKVNFTTTLGMGNRPDLFHIPQLKIRDYIAIEQKLFKQGYFLANESNLDQLPLSPLVEAMVANRDGKMSDAELNAFVSELEKQDIRDDINRYLRQQSINQQYALSLTGGESNNRFGLSVGYDNSRSNVVGNGNQRITLNSNQQFKLFKNRLDVSWGAFYSESKQELNGINNFRYSNTDASYYPYGKLVDHDGNALPIIWDYSQRFKSANINDYMLDWEFKPIDEVKLRDNTQKTVNQRINTRIGYRVFDLLKVNLMYQYSRNNNTHRNNQSQETYYARDLINRYTEVLSDGTLKRPIPLGGVLDHDHRFAYSHDGRIQLDFSKTWGGHQIDAIGGSEIRLRNQSQIRTRFYGYNDDYAISQKVDFLQIYPLYHNKRRTASIQNNDQIAFMTDRFLSYYTNIGYSYDGKYSLSLSARKDMSNLFGVTTNQKGIPLYSIGAAWNLQKESFWSLDILDFAKLRATYGYNGNIDKSIAAQITIQHNPGTSRLSPYATIKNPPNPELRWERVEIINIGLDYGAFKGRINGTIEAYNKNGQDLIGDSPFPSSSGIISFRGNTANTKGYGLEFSINSKNLVGKFQWNTYFQYSYVKDVVSKYLQPVTSYWSIITTGSSISPIEGKTLYALYSLPWAGLDPETGDPRGYLNGEVSKDYAKLRSPSKLEDIVYHGPTRAPHFGSLRNSYEYRGFIIDFNLTFRFGHFFRRESVYYGGTEGLQSNHGDYYKRWLKPGDEKHTNVPSLPLTPNGSRDQFYMYSEALVEKSDHIRFDDLRISYDFKRFKNSKIGNSMKIFVYTKNLGRLWVANSAGLEPEYANIPQPFHFSVGAKLYL